MNTKTILTAKKKKIYIYIYISFSFQLFISVSYNNRTSNAYKPDEFLLAVTELTADLV